MRTYLHIYLLYMLIKSLPPSPPHGSLVFPTPPSCGVLVHFFFFFFFLSFLPSFFSQRYPRKQPPQLHPVHMDAWPAIGHRICISQS